MLAFLTYHGVRLISIVCLLNINELFLFNADAGLRYPLFLSAYTPLLNSWAIYARLQ